MNSPVSPRRYHRWVPSSAQGITVCALCDLQRRIEKNHGHGSARLYSFRSDGGEGGWTPMLSIPECTSAVALPALPHDS